MLVFHFFNLVNVKQENVKGFYGSFAGNTYFQELLMFYI